MKSIVKRNFLSELQAIDWDFVGENTSDAGVGLHWYPARFVPQIPSNLVGYFSEKGDTVLDPFCGCGTALLESFRLDRKPIGIDINPVAILITKAKLTNISIEQIESFTAKVTSSIAKKLLTKGDITVSAVPNLEENSRWYHPETLVELASIYSVILDLDDNLPEKIISKCCFSAILNRVCSQDRHFGWICDGVHPTELKYKKASEAFNQKLVQFTNFIGYFRQSLKATEPRVTTYEDVDIHQADSRDLTKLVSDNRVDLIITSPPYLSVTDYNKSSRLTMLWFGPDNWEGLKQSEIGARFKRARKSSLEDYIEDSHKYMAEFHRVLDNKKYLCLIIGESSSHPAYVELLLNIAQEIGFDRMQNIRRNISVKRRRLFPRVQTEEIVILRKRK